MEAALVDVVRESHGTAGTDANAEAAALADFFVNLYGDAPRSLGHGCYFVARAPLPPQPSVCLPRKLDMGAEEQPGHIHFRGPISQIFHDCKPHDGEMQGERAFLDGIPARLEVVGLRHGSEMRVGDDPGDRKSRHCLHSCALIRHSRGRRALPERVDDDPEITASLGNMRCIGPKKPGAVDVTSNIDDCMEVGFPEGSRYLRRDSRGLIARQRA
jgi:hypothetical protein